MKTNVLLSGLKEFHHHPLGKPDRLILKANIYLGLAIFGLINEELAGAQVCGHAGSPLGLALIVAVSSLRFNFPSSNPLCGARIFLQY
jgi:hypothetical protein